MGFFDLVPFTPDTSTESFTCKQLDFRIGKIEANLGQQSIHTSWLMNDGTFYRKQR